MRSWTITIAAAFWVAASACAAPAEVPHRPNIVFIYADDWRWDCLGVVQREQGEKARFPWLQTPQLDKLAQESLRFRQSFVVNSLCSPGRACVLTSRYSHLNGIIGNTRPFPVDAPTFSKQLQKAGYATGYCGKFHMDSQRERPGFDFVASFIGQGKYFDCPILLDGKQTPTEGWVDDVSTDYAVKFLGEQSNDKPFFLWLGFKSPHGPRGGENLPERFRTLYANDESRDVPNLEVPAIFNVGEARKAGQAAKKNRGFAGHRAYMQHITAIDGEVGRVVAALQKNGQWDNTVVIVASDNGYYLGEHELGDKRSAYDESLRVPLLVRMPGEASPGSTSDAMVLNIDYAPTILDIAKAEPLPDAQGRSLLPILKHAEPGDWRKWFFYEYFAEAKFLSPTVLALRTATQKLITYPEHDEWTEVFDLTKDPYEIRNLVGDEALVKKLRAEFDVASRAVGFRMPEKTAVDDEVAPKRRQRKRRPQ